jgi:hypothetical protein
MTFEIYLRDPSDYEVFRALRGISDCDAKLRISADWINDGVRISWSFLCCVVCGAKLSGRQERFCSDACNNAQHRGTEGRKRYERERYLRLKAAGLLSQVRPKPLLYERPCARCGKPFSTTKPERAYCGSFCKRKAFHEDRRKYEGKAA